MFLTTSRSVEYVENVACHVDEEEDADVLSAASEELDSSQQLHHHFGLQEASPMNVFVHRQLSRC